MTERSETTIRHSTFVIPKNSQPATRNSTDDFKQFTRSKTIDTPTRSSETIYRHAVRLLDEYQLTHKIRLIGVGTSGFQSPDRPIQLNLFDRINESDKTWEKVDRTVETITQRFGRDAIKRGTLKDQ